MNKNKNKPIRIQPDPILRFSPYAWAKLIFMRDCTDNEVGAFGITDPDDLLFIEDIVIVKQTVSMVTVAFDDLAVADFFEQQVDLGRKPEQFARIWVHSHPGSSPIPSMTDEQTFARVFGGCNWSVMFIVAHGNHTFARLRFGIGPGGDIEIPVCVDYGSEFAGSNVKAWHTEYQQHVKELPVLSRDKQQARTEIEPFDCEEPACLTQEVIEELEQMHPDQRQQFMDELAVHSEFWDEEMEVFYE